jgi:hypothetical protein
MFFNFLANLLLMFPLYMAFVYFYGYNHSSLPVALLIYAVSSVAEGFGMIFLVESTLKFDYTISAISESILFTVNTSV